jgi:transcriptional regulator with XRE-family HTH domain
MQALAQAVGLKNKGSIGQFETSLNIPSADTLVALADYFDVSLDYLVGRSDNPDRK